MNYQIKQEKHESQARPSGAGSSALQQYVHERKWNGTLYGRVDGWTLLHWACYECGAKKWMLNVVEELLTQLKGMLPNADFVAYLNELTEQCKPIGCMRNYPSRRFIDF